MEGEVEMSFGVVEFNKFSHVFAVYRRTRSDGIMTLIFFTADTYVMHISGNFVFTR
jgi:hypothetical protein